MGRQSAICGGRACKPLLVVFILLILDKIPSRSAFTTNPMLLPSTSSSVSSMRSPKYSTELHMGLRSFLNRKVLGKKDPENPQQNSNPSNSKAPASSSNNEAQSRRSLPKQDILSSAPATRAANGQKHPVAKPPQSASQRTVRMGEDPTTGKIDVESRLGPETVQERIRRIKRGEMSAEEKEAFLKSALSTGNTPESRLPLRPAGSDSIKSASASPFPTDSILRNMARGNKPGTSEDIPTPVMDSQSKKRKYLDMVTNPNRFDTYKNVKPTGKTSADDGVPNDSRSESSEASTDAMELKAPNVPKDLGARLGAAALQNEKRNAEIRKQQLEKERELERKRQEREKRLLEAQRQRQEELAKREAEILKRRKAKEEESKRSMEISKMAEEARRAELLKAQDDYWTKKLAENKKLQEKKQNKQQQPDKEPAVAEESATAEDSEAQTINGEKNETETEGGLESVEEEAPSTQPRFSGNNMINRAVTQVFGQQPLNDVLEKKKLNDVPLAASSFQADQARKRAEREKEQQDQIARLRSLNSPLPAHANYSARSRPERKPSFEPQKPVSARAQSPAQSLGDLTKTLKSPNGVTKIPPKKDLPKVSEPHLVEDSILEVEDENTSRGSSFNPFSRLTGNKKDKTEAPSRSKSVTSPPPAPKPVPERKGPIRMELPLIDEDDEPEMTEGMTIGEIMKRQRASSGVDQTKRSKQWGVDMSRFKE